MSKLQQTYNAAIYIRLSKDDGDKLESNSISNQRDLIHSFLRSNLDIELCSERVDDGFSGVNFDRPAIIELLKDIKAGSINCVIVKDLSRFGRNYIETGRYIEQIFPFMGVRFIAINDNYDSAAVRNQSDRIIVPFKNLMNDSYSRDISIKVRSQLEVRQKHGDFIGSFPVYGYCRSEEDNHKLIIDDIASDTVRNIYKWKVEGLSNQKIADKLNESGVPSPLEYKALSNWAFTTSFKLKPQAKWSAVAVGRILKNEIYTGVMIQGKETTPNYKIKKRVKRPSSEWIRVENTHDAIISKNDFALVNKLMRSDTRIAPDNDSLYLFSGFLECADCGRNMIRKPTWSEGKEYIYYICSANKQNKSLCGSSHRISERQLVDCTLKVLQHQIQVITVVDDMLNYIETLPLGQVEIQKVNKILVSKRLELNKYQCLKHSLYEDYKEGILSKNDYLEMKKDYEQICDDTEKAIFKLEAEIADLLKNSNTHSHWVELFKKHSNLTELTRTTMLALVNKIHVVNRNRIRIFWNYQNEFESAMRLINMASCTVKKYGGSQEPCLRSKHTENLENFDVSPLHNLISVEGDK